MLSYAIWQPAVTVHIANMCGMSTVCHLVQGSPLLPESLAKVGAKWAQTIIVVADSSRCASVAGRQPPGLCAPACNPLS